MTTPTGSPRKSLEPFLKDSVEYFEHQVKGVRILAKMDSFLLADDMGLGKSLQALTVFSIDVKMGASETCIVVCPVTLRLNWVNEIEKFTRIPYTLFGEEPDTARPGQTKKLSVEKRREQLLNFMSAIGPRILIVNYEQLVSAHHAETFRNFKFDVAIYDEAHYIKNPDSQRTKASLNLTSRRSFMLTGTPVMNQVNELWPLLHRIDPARFPRYRAFINRYCVFGGWEGRQIVGVKNEKELKEILAKVMLRRMKKDVLTLKEPMILPVYVGLTKEQQDLYNPLADELLLMDPYGNPIEMDEDEQMNSLTKFLRLKQICATPYALGPEYPDSSYKLDRTVEIIAEQFANGEKVGVFTQFRPVLDALNERLRKAKLGPVFFLHGDIPASDRVPTVDAWSRVKGSAVIACMSQVAGVGLNMTAGRVLIRIDRLFTPGANDQIVDRFNRIGQNAVQPVQVYDITARGTVEHRIEEILREKRKLFKDIVEGGVGVRRLFEQLLKQLKEEQ